MPRSDGRILAWRRPGEGRAGFTLIEVLIAFVIMTIMLGAIFKAFSGGLNGLDASEGYAIAAMQAQSKLAEIGIASPLETGVTNGIFENETQWDLDISPFDMPGQSPDEEQKTLAFKVVLKGSWDKNRSLTFETLRLGEQQ